MALIDKQLTEYFASRGINLADYVSKPTDAIDAAELDDVEARLHVSASGVTDEDWMRLTQLRNLAGRNDLSISKGEGVTWGTKVTSTLSEQDMTVIKRHLPTSLGMGIEVDGAAWAKLVALRGVKDSGVDAAFLSRLARAAGAGEDGKTRYTDAPLVPVKVDVVPRSETLSPADLDFIFTAYRINVHTKLDADAMKAIARAMAQNGITESEQALLDRISAASTAGKSVKFNGVDVKIDVLSPTTRELEGMLRRYGVQGLGASELAALARSIDTDPDSGALGYALTLRRLVQASGREVTVFGKNVVIDAKLTPAEVNQLGVDFFAQGFDFADGVIDANDIERLAIGFHQNRTGQTEREIIMARLLATGSAYDVTVGDKKVRIDPYSLTADDVATLIDVYGLPVSGKDPALIDHASKQAFLKQLDQGGVPSGLASTIRQLKTGQTVSKTAFATFRSQVSRRLELLLKSDAKSPEHERLAQRLQARFAAIPFVPFAAASADDQLLLKFATELLTSPGGVDPKLSAMLLRLDHSNGKTVKTSDSRSFKVQLEAPPVAAVADDQAMHDYLTRVSRTQKGATLLLDGQHLTIKYTDRDELKGNETTVTATVSQNGVAVRALFDSSFPVHPDVWLGFSLGVGGAYEKVGSAHNVRLEGRGGANLTWYMSRHLRMRLDARAYAIANVGLQYDEQRAEAAKEGASADFEAFRNNVSAKAQSWKDDVVGFLSAGGRQLSQQARTVIAEEVRAAMPGFVNAMMALGFAQITPGTADDQAARTQLDNVQAQMFAAMEQRLGSEVFTGDTVKAVVAQIRQRTDAFFRAIEPDLRQLGNDAGKRAAQPFAFSYGVSVGGDVTWQARIPLVSGRAGALYFSPYAQAYVNVPVVGNNATSLLSTERTLGAPTFGGRASLGLDARLGRSPVHLGLFAGVDARAKVEGGQVKRDVVAPFAGLRFFSEW